MSWRLGICHRTGYRYNGPVAFSYNEARLTPLTTNRQVVLESSLDVYPPASTLRYWDYWGTLVHAFDVHVAHTQLAVTAASVVETSSPLSAPHDTSWEDLSGLAVADRFAELLLPTSYVPTDPELVVAADRFRTSCSTPVEACEVAAAWVREKLTYKSGSTTVSTSALEALGQGTGVCQDFAHLTLGLVRAMGMPARYVSGYLHPSDEAEVGSTQLGEGHAWVEVWLGDWWPIDPTNAQAVGERYVVLARARDYADVSPLKGVYRGAPSEALAVSVELTRLA
ncbi:MAG: transglutaminase family protein [Acidimicrobiales bacterium]